MLCLNGVGVACVVILQNFGALSRSLLRRAWMVAICVRRALFHISVHYLLDIDRARAP